MFFAFFTALLLAACHTVPANDNADIQSGYSAHQPVNEQGSVAHETHYPLASAAVDYSYTPDEMMNYLLKDDHLLLYNWTD